VLQSVAECCRVLQGVAGCCRVLQGVAGCCRVLQYVAGCSSVLQCDTVSVKAPTNEQFKSTESSVFRTFQKKILETYILHR